MSRADSFRMGDVVGFRRHRDDWHVVRRDADGSDREDLWLRGDPFPTLEAALKAAAPDIAAQLERKP